MLKALLVDFARVLIFPVDTAYSGGINDLYKKVSLSGDFKFFNYFSLNRDFLDYLESVKDQIPVYMFTSEIIQEDPAVSGRLTGIFTKIYSASEMGFDKKDPEAYKAIAKDLAMLDGEILFIDDNLANITAASDAGMQTLHFKDNKTILELTERLNS